MDPVLGCATTSNINADVTGDLKLNTSRLQLGVALSVKILMFHRIVKRGKAITLQANGAQRVLGG